MDHQGFSAESMKTNCESTSLVPMNSSGSPASAQSLAEATPRKRRVHLRTLDDVAKELARLYRQVDSGALPSSEGTRRAYLLSQLGRTLEAADLERRVALLEQPTIHELMRNMKERGDPDDIEPEGAY